LGDFTQDARIRQAEIHEKGFRLGNSSRQIEVPTNVPGRQFGKIKLGVSTLEDASLDLGSLTPKKYPHFHKPVIIDALIHNDLPKLRAISEEFYRVNGIYSRVCNSMATLYRYDWYVAPEIYDEKVKEDKVIDELTRVLAFLDDSSIASTCENMAREVIVKGAYYGYLVDSKDCCVL